jgi:anti-anti-sigma regulatory factor
MIGWGKQDELQGNGNRDFGRPTMTAQDVVCVHRQGSTVTFRIQGRGTMANSLPLRRFAEQCLAGGATVLRVDLRHAVYLDSTFIGTLLFLKRTACARGAGEFTILSPSPECEKLFKQLGLDGVFTRVAEEPDPGPWTDLCGDTQDVGAVKGTVVQAHRELADLPGQAGEPFRAVVRCLERETPPDSKK